MYLIWTSPGFRHACEYVRCFIYFLAHLTFFFTVRPRSTQFRVKSSEIAVDRIASFCKFTPRERNESCEFVATTYSSAVVSPVNAVLACRNINDVTSDETFINHPFRGRPRHKGTRALERKDRFQISWKKMERNSDWRQIQKVISLLRLRNDVIRNRNLPTIWYEPVFRRTCRCCSSGESPRTLYIIRHIKIIYII